MSDVGRNDPCPCGSGRKYKRCCYAQDREREARLLGGAGAGSPEGLRPEGATDRQVEPAPLLPGRWGRAIDDLDPARDSELLDADGEPILAITDCFTFPVHKHREVQAALLGAPGLSVVPGEAGLRGVGLTVATHALPGLEDRDDLELRLILLEERIDILSFEPAVADAIVAFVERTLGGLVRRGPREALSPEEFMQQTLSSLLAAGGFPGDDPGEAWPDDDTDDDVPDDDEDEGADDDNASPEVLAVLGEFMTRHYAKWLDDPLPALAGRTPRQVARQPGTPAYRELETILQDIERTEGSREPDRRYDVGILRRALGMPATRP